jgi:long-chain acyl-CoA synthetase
MNIAQHLEFNSLRYPNQLALIFANKRWRYAELNALVNRAANYLLAHNVQTGDRVALYLPNIPAFIIAYQAVVKIGAIAVSINAMFKQQEIAEILDDCTPVIVITTADLLNNLPPKTAKQAQIISHFEPAIQSATPHLQIRDMTPDAPAAIVYTSGTTGTSKGATLSHKNVLTNLQAKSRYCGITARDNLLLNLPLFHCFGQNAIMNSAFYSGATLILQERFIPEEVIQAIEQDQVTMLFGVPAQEKHDQQCRLQNISCPG